MRLAFLIVGILCILVAAIWILQGTYVLKQGFMAGSMRWTYIGIVVAAAGILLVVLGLTLRRRT